MWLHCYKWHTPQRFIGVGDIVLIKDDTLFDKAWPTARVIEVHPGTDGLVRVARVKTAKGTYRRAVTRLVPLFYIRIAR